MLARRLTTIVPAMRLADALETMRNHRLAGRTRARTAVVITRLPLSWVRRWWWRDGPR
jgi:CBS domain-containing protein